MAVIARNPWGVIFISSKDDQPETEYQYNGWHVLFNIYYIRVVKSSGGILYFSFFSVISTIRIINKLHINSMLIINFKYN